MPTTQQYAAVMADPTLSPEEKAARIRDMQAPPTSTVQITGMVPPGEPMAQAPVVPWDEPPPASNRVPESRVRPLFLNPDLSLAPPQQAASMPPPVPAPDPRQQQPQQMPNPFAPAIGQLAGQRRRFQGQMGQAQRQMDEGFRRQEDAAGMMGEAQRDQAEHDAMVLEEYNLQAREMQERQARQEAARVEALREAESELSGIAEDIRTHKIDPNRLQGKATRVAIGNTIGNAFGVMAAAKLGVAGNTFAQTAQQNIAQLNAEIERDISAQREELDSKKSFHQMRAQGLQMMRNRFVDERQAEAAQRYAAWEDVERRVQLKAAQTRIPGIEAEVEQYLGGIQQQKAKAGLEVATIANENATRSILQEEKLRMQGMAMMAQQAKGSGVAPAQDTAWLDESAAASATADDRKEVQKRMKVQNKIDSDLSKLIEWRQKHGAEVVDRKAINEIRFVMDRLKNTLRHEAEAGANFTESEQELLYGNVPLDPSSIGFVLDQYRAMQRKFQQETDDHLRAYGARRVPRAASKVQPAQ